MAALSGQAVNATIGGLVTFPNNTGVTGSLQTITDGAGVSTALRLSTISAAITGTFSTTGASTFGSNVSVTGNLTVSGYTTNINGFFNVKAYGAIGDGSTDDTSAFASAITAAAAISSLNASGTTIVIPPGTYKITSLLTIPPHITVLGSGCYSTRINSTVAGGFTFQIGNSTTVLSYGCKIADLSIYLGAASTYGINLVCTVGAIVKNIYIEGIGPTANTHLGIQVDGASESSFYNTIENVNCNHCKFGYKVYSSTGLTYATDQMFINCSLYADNMAGSIAYQFTENNGTSSTIIGGNIEGCISGITSTGATNGASCITFQNVWFNTASVTLKSLDTQWSFINCLDIDLSSLPAQNGFAKHTVLGCLGGGSSSGALSQIEAPHLFYSPAAASVPLTIVGYSSQSANLFLIKNSSGSTLVNITSAGVITGTIAATGTFSGTIGASTINNILTLSGSSAYFKADSSIGFRVYDSAGSALLLRVPNGGNVELPTPGTTLSLNEASNGCMGTATLNGTTAVVVNTTAVGANSRVFVTINTPGGTVGSPYVFTRVNGTSFSLKSTNASDTSTVAWFILQPTS